MPDFTCFSRWRVIKRARGAYDAGKGRFALSKASDGEGRMDCTICYSDLKKRDVINIVDGARLGCVCDLELEVPGGRVLAIIVPGPMRFFGLLRGDPISIPFSRIKKFGEDVILVEIC